MPTARSCSIRCSRVSRAPIIRDQIEAASKTGSAWIDGYCFKLGTTTQARQQAFVRRIDIGGKTYFVGSAVFLE